MKKRNTELIRERLREAFATNKQMQNYSGYLLIREGSNVIFEGDYGYADWRKLIPANRDTIYLIGSLTKVFTAICIMQLEQKSALHISDRLISYFPDFTVAREVTIAHLLSHSSGISDYWNRVGISSIDYTDAGAIFEFIKTFDLVEKPGGTFRYCNSNFIILGMLIERITGMHYADYLQQKILTPLDMTRSGLIPGHHQQENVAIGYMRIKPDVKEAAKPENTIILGNPFSAGSLYSTANDLLKFDMGLNENALLPEQKKYEMWKLQNGGYGYGWFTEGNKVWHGGDIPGFSVTLIKYLKDDITVIALTNNDGKRECHIGHYSKIIEDCIYDTSTD